MRTGGGVGDEHELMLTAENALRWAKVVRNDDPKKLGRITCFIPGITEKESDWALPVGFPATGSAEKGSYRPPPVGSTVLVGFVLGDVDEIFYLSGPAPAPPTKVQEKVPSEAPQVQVIAETEKFQVYISDMPSERKLAMSGLEPGSSTLEIDLLDGSIHLKASHFLILEGPLVEIRGRVQIGNRPVNPVGGVI
jgi:hypothetical protein